MKSVFHLLLFFLFCLPEGSAQAPLNVRHKGSLAPGEIIQGNTCLVSNNHQYLLMVEYSGDLVVKKIEKHELSDDGRFLENYELSHVWSLGTQGNGSSCQLRFQRDGNLCLYKKNGSALWSTESTGGKKLLILDDTGWLGIYDQQETLIWNMREAKPSLPSFQFISTSKRPQGASPNSCACLFSPEETNAKKAFLITDKLMKKVLLNISGKQQNFIWKETQDYIFENLNYISFCYIGKNYDLEIRMIKDDANTSTEKKIYLILKTKDQNILKTKRLIGYCTC